MLLNRHRKTRFGNAQVAEQDSKNQTASPKKNTNSQKQIKKTEKSEE